MIETGIQSELAGATTTAASRVYPVRLPQNVTYPALAYRVITDPRDETHSGPSGNVTARYDIIAFGRTYNQAKTLAAEARAFLLGFSGDMGGVDVHNIRHDGDRDLVDQDSENNRGVFMIVGEYIFEYHET